MKKNELISIIAAGCALFSMFFGAGDMIWPLILGGNTLSQVSYATAGLLITGVTLPLLGLCAMMLYGGDCKSFFGRIGAMPGFFLLFIIQAILGPVGSIPRLITLSYATLKPYLPTISLGLFSIICSLVFLGFSLRKQKIVSMLGLVLSPLLLLCLGAILVLGFVHAPQVNISALASKDAFYKGMSVGYNTLDLIASFIFAPMVLGHFKKPEESFEDPALLKQAAGKMLKASLLAAFLLTLMFTGLTHVSSVYSPLLPEHVPEERLRLISSHLLGTHGAFISCIAVALACLTTAIPLVSISAEYINEELFKNKRSKAWGLFLTLAISTAIANLGFIGIAEMLSPVLYVLCPGLIVLAVLNIMHKVYEMRLARLPVYAAFGISTANYFLMKFL